MPPGTFLVRFSNHEKGAFATSFVGANGQVLKGLITRTNDGYQVLNQGVVFPTLDDVIAYYKGLNILLYPYQAQ